MEVRLASVAFLFLLSLASIANVASAGLMVQPAKLGILRLQLFPMSPAVAVRELKIGNTYNVSMDVQLSATDNMTSIMSFSDTNFTLMPNQNKTIEYTVSVNEPGYYYGGILIKASTPNSAGFGYSADLDLYVYKSNLQPYFYVGAAAVIAIAALGFILFFKKSTRKKAEK